MENCSLPLRIRAHNLICIQGFRGFGYTPEFIENMQKVVDYLRLNPDTPVRVVAGFDVLCEKCPHRDMEAGRCRADDERNPPRPGEKRDRATVMDRKVLRKLRIRENEVKLWGELLYIIGRSVDSSSMDAVCGDCRWKALSFCAQGLDCLAEAVRSGKGSGNC